MNLALKLAVVILLFLNVTVVAQQEGQKKSTAPDQSKQPSEADKPPAQLQEKKTEQGNADKIENEKVKKEVRSQFEKLSKYVDKFEFEKAKSLMTTEGWDSLLVEQVVMATEFARMDGDEVEEFPIDQSIIDSLAAICKKHGLDKLEPIGDIDVVTMEETERIYQRYTKRVVKFVPVEQQAAVIKDIYQAMKKLEMMAPEPFGTKILEQKVSDDTVVLTLETDFGDGPQFANGENEDIEVEFVTPPMVAKFKKKNGKWLWDGIDFELTSKAMEEFLSEEGMEMPTKLPIIENFELAGEALSGKKIDIKDYRGKIVLVDFWGTWCQPCVAELPVLKEIRGAFKKHGFEIIGVAANGESELKAFTEKKLQLPWENIVDGKMELSKKFNIQAYPTTLLIDKEGNHVKSDLAGLELVDELIERFKLDADEFKDLRKAIRKLEDEKFSSPKLDPNDF